MKIILKIFCSILFVVLITAQSVLPQTIRVMTFNIRLDVPTDGVNAWTNRRENLISLLRFHKVDIAGLQEAQKHQIDYILQSLPEYGWFGVGRDDGKVKGEFTAIFYLKERFDTIATSTFWCSETPEHPGLGWDAAYQRITTFGKFRDKQTDKVFYLFNTHLDNEGRIARLESAKLIRNKMKLICENEPAILIGDFNSTPNSEPYKVIVSMSDTESSFNLYDTRTITKSRPYGPSGTFTGFDINAKPNAPIDFIFVKKGISVLSHGTLSDSFDGYLPSDHYPVLVDILL